MNGNAPEGGGEADLVYYRFIRTGSGGKPVLPIAFSSTRGSVDVPAILTPAAPVTRIAPVWSEAIDMSPGQVVTAQVRASNGTLAGPEVDLVPELDATLGEGVDEEWYAVEGAALGQDFLQHLTVALLGPAQVIAVAFGQFGLAYSPGTN